MSARFALLLLAGSIPMAQELPVRWDELVASDWKRALELPRVPACCLLAFWKNMVLTCRSALT